jgi:hypothetical protein
MGPELLGRIGDLLPAEVLRSVSNHLVKSGHKAEEGFPSGEEDEDTLTGDLLRAVRRPWTRPIEIDGTRWSWCVKTRKFRGHGELATESLIGADGIVQVEITSPGGLVTRKGILFQAKKGWKHRDQILVGQVGKMEKVAPRASVVFDYEADGYKAAAGVLVLDSDGRPAQVRFRRLGEFLAGEFLECIVGRFDTYYDWNSKRLILAGESLWPFGLYPQFLVAVQVEAASKT